MKSICVVGLTAALLLNAVPSARHQASVGSLQDAYKEVDRKDEGTGRRATYTVSAASEPAFAALGMKLLISGGWVMRSDTYAQLENQVCMLRLTLTDASGRLASLTKNATIEGLARIDKASFGSYGVTFQMALTDWAVSPPR